MIAKIRICHRHYTWVLNTPRLAIYMPSIMKVPLKLEIEIFFRMVIYFWEVSRSCWCPNVALFLVHCRVFLEQRVILNSSRTELPQLYSSIVSEILYSLGGCNKIITRWGSETFKEWYSCGVPQFFLSICYSTFCHPSHPLFLAANRRSWRIRALYVH